MSLIKSVMVRLRGDNSDLNRSLLGSATAAKVLDKNLSSADDSSKRLSKGLEVSNDRTTMLVQSALALGPALVPIGAQAAPILMGLATQMTFAAGAASVTALAFSGVGDSLKAVNDYALDPSTAHLKKMNQELGKLGPAGREFVLYLQELRPELQRLQDIAQEGILPGATDSIEQLMTLMPQAERVVGSMATTIGNLMADAGSDLAGPQWEAFFNYIEREAAPILTEMGQTLGNLIQGFANMIVAFDPLTRDFSEGFLQMAKDFESWSDGLADSKGFHNFVDYIESTGPQVADTLGAIAETLIALVQAAAPVGAATLPVLEQLAKALTAILQSDAGPVLIAAAAGLSAVSRAIALYNVANGSAMIGMLTGVAKGAPALTTLRTSGVPAMRDFGTALLYSAHSTDTLTRATESNSKAARTGAQNALIARQEVAKFAPVARAAAAGVGALALSFSDVDDKMGLSHTGILALSGAMLGPWGAAVGGAVGLTMDLAAANDTLIDSMKAAESAAGTLDLNQRAAALADLQTQTEAYSDAVDRAFDLTPERMGSLPDAIKGLSDVFTGAGAEARQATVDFEYASNQIEYNLNVIADAISGVDDGNPRLLDMTMDEMMRFATAAAPAATAAGIDLQQVLETGIGVPELIQAIKDYNGELDGIPGHTQTAGDGLLALKNITDINTDGLIDNTDAILANIDAMNERTDARVAAFDAETAWQRALDEGAKREKERKAIEKQIAEAEADGAKERARIRRDAGEAGADTSRDMAELQRRLADARAALSTARTVSARESARDSIASIQGQIADKQVGSSRSAVDAQERIQESLDQQAETVARLKDQLAGYTNTLDKNTEAGQNNRDVLSDMASKWNALNEKQQNAKGAYKQARDAIIDQAMVFGATRKEAEKYAKRLLDMPPRVQTKLILEKQEAERALEEFKREFYGLEPKTVKLFIKSVMSKNDIGESGDPRVRRADGGPIPGYSPHDRADNILVAATAGEYVQPVAAVDYYGQAFMDAIRKRQLPRFADGGPIRATSVSHATNYYGAQGPLQVQGVLDTPWGPASIRSLAQEIVTQFATQRGAAAWKEATGGEDFR